MNWIAIALIGFVAGFLMGLLTALAVFSVKGSSEG
jgi:hypothetical protein